MKHRKISMYPAACLLAAAALSGMPALAAGTAGDVDGDGSVGKADVQALVTWLTEGKGTPDGTAADLNGDGVLNAKDLTLLKRTLLSAEETDAVSIHLSDSGITYEGGEITVSGKTAQITASGAYYIDGSISGGQILVNIADEAADAGTVKLYLNGVSMVNGEAPCILVENAEKTTVHLEAGKENALSDGQDAPETSQESAYAVLHAKDDLTIKGDGSLSITAGIAYGIHCNNDLKINGGNLSVKTENGDAVRAKTSVTVKDGTLDINTEGDGIKSTKGSVEISGGTVQIKSGKDAIQAETTLSLTGGKIAACGDRGLKSAGTITLDGCTLLATATDNACENLGATVQPSMQLAFNAEWSKGSAVVLTDSAGVNAYEMTALKKFSFALVSAPELHAGEGYSLTVDWNSMKQGNGDILFVPSSDANYTGIEGLVPMPA